MSIELPAKKMMKLNQAFLKEMQHNCFKICIPKRSDGELNSGEKLCLDRCVAKYYETNDLFSQYLIGERENQ